MEADAYADSSFLVSLHRADAFHEDANTFMAKAGLSLAFTPLHRIEVRNALRNAVAGGEMNRAERNLAFRQIDEDLRDGLMVHTALNWTDVFRRADELSEAHSATHGQRTMDLLHVAAALDCGATIFLTFDARQRKLAKATGLKVKP
jgi:predicted nucleic acid-binding protein